VKNLRNFVGGLACSFSVHLSYSGIKQKNEHTGSSICCLFVLR